VSDSVLLRNVGRFVANMVATVIRTKSFALHYCIYFLQEELQGVIKLQYMMHYVSVFNLNTVTILAVDYRIMGMIISLVYLSFEHA